MKRLGRKLLALVLCAAMVAGLGAALPLSAALADADPVPLCLVNKGDSVTFTAKSGKLSEQSIYIGGKAGSKVKHIVSNDPSVYELYKVTTGNVQRTIKKAGNTTEQETFSAIAITRGNITYYCAGFQLPASRDGADETTSGVIETTKGQALYVAEAGAAGFTFELNNAHGSQDLTENNPTVDKPVLFSPAGGSYIGEFDVELTLNWSDNSPDGSVTPTHILYTINGKNTSLGDGGFVYIGANYNGPIHISKTTTIKAIACNSYLGISSGIMEQTYTIGTSSLSVTAPTFDAVAEGYSQPAAKPVTIKSSGNAESTISKIALSGANAGSFSLNTTGGTEIDAGATDDITYTVRPAAGLAPGTYAATITVTYDKGATAAAVGDAVSAAKSAVEAVEKEKKKAADEAAAKAVADLIKALPASAGLNDRGAVEAARKAYDALTEDQKKLVGSDVLNRLAAAEQQVKAAEEAATKEEADEAAAKGAADLIKALPASAGLNDKGAVEAARKAYDALTDDQKKLVGDDVLNRLTAAEQQVKAEEAAREIRIGDCTIAVENLTYTGKKIKKPAVTVSYGDITLTEDADYAVSYNTKAKEIGKYTLTVTGKGRCTGSKTATFKVIPKGTSISKAEATKTGIKLKWKVPKLKKITGYQIQYSLKDDFSSKKTVKIKSASTTSKTIQNLKSGRKYYVRIRTYYTDKKNKTFYSNWSKTKSVKTKGKAASKSRIEPNGELAMNVGETLELLPMLSEAFAGSELTWVTSDPDIATVSQNGVVEAVKPGGVVVTATGEDGDEAVFAIRVRERHGTGEGPEAGEAPDIDGEELTLIGLDGDGLILDAVDEFDEEIEIEDEIELPEA